MNAACHIFQKAFTAAKACWDDDSDSDAWQAAADNANEALDKAEDILFDAVAEANEAWDDTYDAFHVCGCRGEPIINSGVPKLR
jgi:hypothetical protein